MRPPTPVKRMAGAEGLIRVEMEPALTTFAFAAAVPGDAEGLQAAARQFDEILLQRVMAEGVVDAKGVDAAVRAVGLNEELAVILTETGAGTGVIEVGIVEIAQH